MIAPATIDHLVLGTADLAKGSAWLERFLGVTLSAIGQHDAMGTHNRLLRLGADSYLELISIDPTAAPPARARWFGLDTTEVQTRIANRPRLLAWVARTDAIEQIAHASGDTFGRVNPMQRGDFRWRISVPDDGYSPEGGLVPHLIQWDHGGHPCDLLPDQGCALTWMEAAHPQPNKIGYLLDEIGLRDKLTLTATPPYSGTTLCAYLSTPSGNRVLMSQ